MEDKCHTCQKFIQDTDPNQDFCSGWSCCKMAGYPEYEPKRCFSFQSIESRAPEIIIEHKRLNLVAMTHNWSTKSDRTAGCNVIIASGYLEGEKELRTFHLDLYSGSCYSHLTHQSSVMTLYDNNN